MQLGLVYKNQEIILEEREAFEFPIWPIPCWNRLESYGMGFPPGLAA